MILRSVSHTQIFRCKYVFYINICNFCIYLKPLLANLLYLIYRCHEKCFFRDKSYVQYRLVFSPFTFNLELVGSVCKELLAIESRRFALCSAGEVPGTQHSEVLPFFTAPPLCCCLSSLSRTVLFLVLLSERRFDMCVSNVWWVGSC